VVPNVDTLYSSAWLDLSDGPLVVSAPDTAGRYYLLPVYDMWTDAFAVPGRRTSGTREAHWSPVPTGWTGELPPGGPTGPGPDTDRLDHRSDEEGRPADYEAVHAIQDGFRITALSGWPEEAPSGSSTRTPARTAWRTGCRAPAGGFSPCLRLYAPHPEALDGRWNPPPLAVR
jgi:Protein of unknown function (DUF1254)